MMRREVKSCDLRALASCEVTEVGAATDNAGNIIIGNVVIVTDVTVQKMRWERNVLEIISFDEGDKG